MTTQRERLIVALKGLGSEEVPSKSGKYVTLTRPLKPGTFYFVGRAGALRLGRTSSRSIPVSDTFKSVLLGSGGSR